MPESLPDTWSHAALWLLFGMALGAGVLAAAPLLSRLAAELQRGFHRSVSAEPTVLVSNGKVIEHNLEKLKMSREELERLLRERGVCEPAEALAAFAHADGTLAVVRRKHHARDLFPRRRTSGPRQHNECGSVPRVVDPLAPTDAPSGADIAR